jgi:hypothetical protein
MLVAICGADRDGESGAILSVEIKHSHSNSDGDASSISPYLLSVIHRFHNIGNGALRQLRVSPDGKLLASSCEDGCVYIHHIVIKEGEDEVLEPVGNLLAHVDGSVVAAADFSIDSRFVRVFGNNSLFANNQRIEVNFFDFQLDGGASAASMNPLKKFAGGKIQDIGVLESMKKVQWATVGSPAAPEIRGVSMTKDGVFRTDTVSVSDDKQFVAASYEDGTVRVFR